MHSAYVTYDMWRALSVYALSVYMRALICIWMWTCYCTLGAFQ